MHRVNVALPTRDAIVATARESIARGSKSFHAASLLFDRPTRERAWLLYAWCRRCDDIADGQDHGHDLTRVEDASARLAEITAKTEAALAGQIVGDPAFDALGIVAGETAMPHRFARDVIAGFALDADEWRPRSEADLYRYCYHVAGAVGCMMAIVMGVSPDDDATLDRACDLGLAFQLANIARDIEEDDRGGRCYLPEEWLVEMDMPPGQHMKPPFRSRLSVLARRLASLAAHYEASARLGVAALPFRSAWAVLAAAGIYGDIARKVAARGDHAWDHRVTTSPAEKLGWIGRSAIEAAGRGTAKQTPRDLSLWSRPR
ncbi:All-trans-phytoene synthase [Sphingomonas sp. EC-HK361]|uniref:phytoene/squalene synthase family protein n=1 Tax=Sphingomonas sp. EC-HK361 TaxID=2038397 RepID=UPI0012559AA9|nr:phytoene/squalene synthase family protein [Sphingomonas sp. EC-HK361]VVS96229.1 All-trans-phytoene synthase [Sphingomonas sp. EC-HK361]